jgi:hypothetical protein
VQTEIAVKHLYKDAPDFSEAIVALEQRGFTPIGFFPVVKQADNLRVIEFDCVAVRDME